MDAFNIHLGESGLEASWQDPFPPTTPCCRCDGEARIAFVAIEEFKEGERQQFVTHLHDNDPDGEGFWVHDSCAVAVYFCRKCLEPTALMNQA